MGHYDRYGEWVAEDKPPMARVCHWCGQHLPAYPVYDSHSADILFWLCKTCNDRRLAENERFYRGE